MFFKSIKLLLMISSILHASPGTNALFSGTSSGMTGVLFIIVLVLIS